jgi:hypothetical protein
MTFRHSRQLTLRSLILIAALTGSAGVAVAQAPDPVTKQDLTKQDLLRNLAEAQAAQGLNADAGQIRNQLMGIFQQYPPSVREVLQLDPVLMSNANYLALYPRLAAFLSQHPEIAHNPVFFIGLPEQYENRPRDDESFGRNMERIIDPLMVAAVIISLIGILAWVIRAIMNHRRWLRVSKLQTDMQNKLLERFTSNEEMLAFIQTSAGQRFLESASVAAEPGPRALSAPVGRMLWSIQLGIVILVAGVGLEIVSYQLSRYADAVTAFQVTGGIVIALGIGFILSALGSYVLSRRLGLMDPSPTPSIK